MLIFNKQYRNEQKLISEIYKKIRDSKEMTCVGENDKKGERYKLDSVDVVFIMGMTAATAGHGELVVEDKSGNKIYEMDCSWSDPINNDELQQRRHEWFYDLLDLTRKQYNQREAKKEKMKQGAETAKSKAEAKQKQLDAEQIKEAAVVEALARLKEL